MHISLIFPKSDMTPTVLKSKNWQQKIGIIHSVSWALTKCHKSSELGIRSIFHPRSFVSKVVYSTSFFHFCLLGFISLEMTPDYVFVVMINGIYDGCHLVCKKILILLLNACTQHSHQSSNVCLVLTWAVQAQQSGCVQTAKTGQFTHFCYRLVLHSPLPKIKHV